MHRIFYISQSLIEPTELPLLLKQANEANAKIDVTGVLMFTGGCFAQVIEGPTPTLQALMARIEADRRHCRVQRLLDDDVPARRFGDWHMAFIESPGTDDLVSELLQGQDVSPARAQRVLDLMLAGLPKRG